MRVLGFILFACFSCSLFAGSTQGEEIQHLKRSLAEVSFDLRRQPHLNKSEVQGYHDEVFKIYEQAKQLREDLNNQLNEHQDLLSELDSMDEEMNAKRQKSTIQGDVDNLKLRLAQAISLERSSERVMTDINKRFVELAARRLLDMKTPLYYENSWVSAWGELSVVVAHVTALLQSLKHHFIEAFERYLGYLVAAIFTLVQVLLYWPFRRYLHKRPHQSKLVHLLIHAVIDGVLPVLTCISLMLCFLSFGILDSQHHMIYLTIGVIGAAFFSYGVIQAILAPHCNNWRIPHYDDQTARKLYRRLVWFISLVLTLLWIDLLFKYAQLPAYFAQVFRLSIRLILCVNGLMLLKKRFWTKHILWGLFRIFAGIIFVSSPIFIFIGYSDLADYLLLGLIYTVILGLVLAGIYYAVSKGITSLFVEDCSKVSKAFSLSKRGEEILQYWGRFFIGLILWGVAIISLLLVWGLNQEVIYDYGKLLIFGVTIGKYQFSLVNLFLSLVIFFALFTLTRYLQKFLEKKVFPFTNFDKGLQHALKIATGYLGTFVTIIISLSILGFHLSSLLYVLGGLSVGIGLGFQPIVTNFVSGIIMLIERPIRIGDIVDLPDGMGVVTRISVRATEVRTFDRCSVLVPNTQMINNVVKNWTHENASRRILVPISVAYGNDPKAIRETLLDIARNAPKASKELEPAVVFDEFGDSGLNFKVFVFVDDLVNYGEVAHHVKFEIERVFKEQGIEIPYPKQEVYVHKNAS
ncbi:MAG: hypothetical protein SP1CHLAM54_07090 [Chlamydiia bacterium]|nr:hypothetical protein [Chlamydiia bacterium]MCH9615615.1 hypothetical protein [Chlamydiia bacterium]MCH9628982.1 hypothetical protein [Chlamydiia bacterium]